jgi:hypothetical protein
LLVACVVLVLGAAAALLVLDPVKPGPGDRVVATGGCHQLEIFRDGLNMRPLVASRQKVSSETPTVSGRLRSTLRGHHRFFPDGGGASIAVRPGFATIGCDGVTRDTFG